MIEFKAWAEGLDERLLGECIHIGFPGGSTLILEPAEALNVALALPRIAAWASENLLNAALPLGPVAQRHLDEAREAGESP